MQKTCEMNVNELSITIARLTALAHGALTRDGILMRIGRGDQHSDRLDDREGFGFGK